MEIHPASFRDPGGTVVSKAGTYYRLVWPTFKESYDKLLGSGLYDRLARERLLVPHQEVSWGEEGRGAHRVLRPEQLRFISYPYEWSFSQLKDAALLTLRLAREALHHEMILRDASAFNIQFHEGRPILIDSLSFEPRSGDHPWQAYHQFCRHFLAPLALAAYRDIRLTQLSRVHLDGVPLDLASALLPWRSWLNPWLLLHLHAHAASTRRFAARKPDRSRRFSLSSMLGLLQGLESALRRLRPKPAAKVWSNYYEESVSGGRYVPHKQSVVGSVLAACRAASLWDLGCNTGVFSRMASQHGIPTLAFDGDPACVELLYAEVKQRGDQRLLPLVMDLANPSPGLGWENRERAAWLERPRPDLVLALALVHHLAIGNNLPLERIAGFFKQLAPSVLIEFVPKHDPNARKLLHAREDIFPNYTQTEFERVFQQAFALRQRWQLEDTDRVLYWFERIEAP